MLWIVFALLAALSAASVVTLSKAGIKQVDPILAFAIESVLIVVVAWSAVAVSGKFPQIKVIEGKAWAYLIAAGIITTFSSLLSFQALKLGNASQVSPVQTISLVFAILLAATFLKEKISWQIIVGAFFMVGGAILIAFARKS